MSARGLSPSASPQSGGPASRGRAVWARPSGLRHLRSWWNFPAVPPLGRPRPRAWVSGRSAPRSPSGGAHSRAAGSRDPTAPTAILVARRPLRKSVARASRAVLRATVGRGLRVGAPGGVAAEPPAVGFPCASFPPGSRAWSLGRGGRGRRPRLTGSRQREVEGQGIRRTVVP